MTELQQRALELRREGRTTREIATELSVGVKRARFLVWTARKNEAAEGGR